MLHFTFQKMRAFYGPWPRGLGLKVGTLLKCCGSAERFIPDPGPALNFPSSGSGSGSRQKFRIHAVHDPDPTQVIQVYWKL